MTYEVFKTVPAYVAPEWSDDGRRCLNTDDVRWSGLIAPPPVGTRIKVKMNNLGEATVKGYFVEDNWLGLLVRLHNPPEWHRKQDANRPAGPSHIFGCEFELANERAGR